MGVALSILTHRCRNGELCVCVCCRLEKVFGGVSRVTIARAARHPKGPYRHSQHLTAFLKCVDHPAEFKRWGLRTAFAALGIRKTFKSTSTYASGTSNQTKPDHHQEQA